MRKAPEKMKALRVHGPDRGLSLDEVRVPSPSEHEVLLQVLACGVCRTDLHILDADLPDLRYPITPGHEIVVGVPWLARTCGRCQYCNIGLENLCEEALFTGYTAPGGYAQYVTADSRYCLLIPDRYSDIEAAPLLCAGLIGYRAYRAAGDAPRLGLYGFGASAHLLAQIARADGRHVYALTRPGDSAAQEFARRLGAVWAGGSDEAPPQPLDAAIIFAAVGALVPSALAAIRPGGRVVCAGIHMSDIPTFPYRLLWRERSISSVANLTRADGAAFMQRAATMNLKPVVEPFALEHAPEALSRLKTGQLEGAAVLVND
jgi:propanol-preferring alcohol dehydrogenase